VRFEQPAQEATLLDYLHEVEHAVERIQRLERSIDQAIQTVPEKMRAVIQGLQSLRGIAKISAVSIVAELGEISRFQKAAQLMGYSGAVSRENSSGERTQRGAISKAGNAHLRRIVVEAAWSYRHRPSVGAALAARQKDLGEPYAEEVKEMAWKAQHRLHNRYSKLSARGKTKQKVVTAVGRELLGFVWAIGTHVERALSAKAPRRRAA
jgi:transposase